jgi:hypothetical protein
MADTLIKGHLNQLLTNFSVAQARQGGWIADQAAPPLPVTEYSDTYLIFGDEDFDLDDMRYAGKSHIARVDWSESLDSYKCKEYAEEAEIPWLEMRNPDAALRKEQRYASGLVRKARLRREVQVAGLYATTAFPDDKAAKAWDDLDAAVPTADIKAGKDAIRDLIGLVPDTLIISGHVWSNLQMTSDITNRLAGLVAGTPASLAQAATALGLRQILVGTAVYKTGGALVPVWGDDQAILAWIDSDAGAAEGAIQPVKQFVCDVAGAPFSTFTYEENQTRSHVVQVYDCVDAKVTAAAAAYIITGVKTAAG